MGISRIMKRKNKGQDKACTCSHCGSTEKLLDDIATMMNIHFGSVEVEDCTCEQCLDFKEKVCQGENRKGIACGMCMENKVRGLS
jgi:hypothetical protein